MARSSLQLAAGLLLLAGLLGLSTALIAEVREEVRQASEETEGSPAREIQHRAGLPVPELTLLDPTRAQVPDREPTDDGFRTTGPGRLHLSEGDGIQPGPITVGADARLELGQGWELDDAQLTCTSPCLLTLDGTELTLPSDAALVTPRSSSGIDLGPAPQPGTQTRLPADTRLELPPVRFPSGTQLALRAGASAELPPGTEARPLADGVRQLPAGTTITRSTAAEEDRERLADLLDRADRQAPQAPPLEAEQASIEVTETPATIEKGQPFTVSGLVEGAGGVPSAGHPVTVFANASKQAPGLPLHTEPTLTDADGRFTTRLILPEDAPARPYHILAHAHARNDTDPPLQGAWSDPLVGVEAEANLTLDLPEATGVGVPLGLRAHLTDEHDAPVPNQTVLFQLADSDVQLTARTNAEGEALAVLEDGLPYPGNYTIQARFPGTGNITGDADETAIEAIHARIEAPATHTAQRGEATEIDGRVVAEEGDPGKVRVQATYADDVTAATSTDPQGHFTLELPVPTQISPGNHTVELEAAAVDARHRLVLTAQAPLLLDTPDLGPQPLGARVPLPVDVRTDQGEPVPGIPITATEGERRVDRDVTDADGRAHLAVPLPSAGTHELRLEATTPARYTAEGSTVELQAAPLEVDSRLRLPPGRATNTSLTLTVEETPLGHTPIQLVGPGFVGQTTTDAQGQARLRLQAPSDSVPGRLQANLSLPALDVTTDVPGRILEQPQLTVEITQAPREGQPLHLTVRAHADDAPVPEVPVLVRTSGAFQARDQAITDEQGRARLVFERPDDAEGPLQVDVLAEATPSTARAAATASAQATPTPTPWGWILAAAAAGLATVAAVRHHRRQAPEPRTLTTDGPQLSLELATQEGNLGPVWHPGESTSLRVELRDADGGPIPGVEVAIDGPPGRSTLTLDDEGRARVGVPPQATGTHTYRARVTDDAIAAETVLEVRIVDYREEIDRRYRRLHRAAVRLGLIQPDATPRELADALGPPAPELARLFERSDYAPHPVDREDYERFMHLLQEADPREPDP